jgi:hypothetical protein
MATRNRQSFKTEPAAGAKAAVARISSAPPEAEDTLSSAQLEIPYPPQEHEKAVGVFAIALAFRRYLERLCCSSYFGFVSSGLKAKIPDISIEYRNYSERDEIFRVQKPDRCS